MPQVDTVTFYPIIFWTFIIYTFGYLFLSATTLFSFFSSLKLFAKRTLYIYGTSCIRYYYGAQLKYAPWISLRTR